MFCRKGQNVSFKQKQKLHSLLSWQLRICYSVSTTNTQFVPQQVVFAAFRTFYGPTRQLSCRFSNKSSLQIWSSEGDRCRTCEPRHTVCPLYIELGNGWCIFLTRQILFFYPASGRKQVLPRGQVVQDWHIATGARHQMLQISFCVKVDRFHVNIFYSQSDDDWQVLMWCYWMHGSDQRGRGIN